MAVFNLFSKRQKALRGEMPDVFTYDSIPLDLRVQIIHIVRDAFGEDDGYHNLSSRAFKLIHSQLCREYGKFTLGGTYDTDAESLFKFFVTYDKDDKNDEKIIDVIEIFFKYIDKVIREDRAYFSSCRPTSTPDQAIDELNQRFKESGIGYQFESGEIIRIDSMVTHTEIVKPTLILLQNRRFAGPNEEYLKAHEHYRQGRNKECLTECLKALESTIKVICNLKGWDFKPTDTAKKLIQVCFEKELIPAFTQNQFTSLQNLIESGIPTIRNKVSAHGQGETKQHVDDKMTRYGLNLTGTNIIFLIELSGLKN